RDALKGEAETYYESPVKEASADNGVRAVEVFEQNNDSTIVSEMQLTDPAEALTIKAQLASSFLHHQGNQAEGNIPQQEEERGTEIVRSTGPIEILCCYARKDKLLLKELKTHLIPLQRQGLISIWHDADISAGMEWEVEINKHLNADQVILLLVSPDFMASDYCYSKELKRAIERHERGEARVIPIILRRVLWKVAPLNKLQALPT